MGTKATPPEYWAINSILVNTKRGKATRAVPPYLASSSLITLKGTKLGTLEYVAFLANSVASATISAKGFASLGNIVGESVNISFTRPAFISSIKSNPL